ncbi:hypothetical protein BHM03_00028360 [Ensete ventricosum]|nr:hypothetical protein BHM03_00028360 [Ensete ventricosum]
MKERRTNGLPTCDSRQGRRWSSNYRVFSCPRDTCLVNGGTDGPKCGLHRTLTVVFSSVQKLANYGTNVPCPYSYFGSLDKIPSPLKQGTASQTIGEVPRLTKAKMSGSQYCRGKLFAFFSGLCRFCPPARSDAIGDEKGEHGIGRRRRRKKKAKMAVQQALVVLTDTGSSSGPTITSS